MTQTIQFEVIVERHEPSGAFVATCADFPRKSGVGPTEAEAVADLRAKMPEQFLQPIPPPEHSSNPWLADVGRLPTDELTAEWKRIVQERRDVSDSEPARD